MHWIKLKNGIIICLLISSNKDVYFTNSTQVSYYSRFRTEMLNMWKQQQLHSKMPSLRVSSGIYSVIEEKMCNIFTPQNTNCVHLLGWLALPQCHITTISVVCMDTLFKNAVFYFAPQSANHTLISVISTPTVPYNASLVWYVFIVYSELRS